MGCYSKHKCMIFGGLLLSIASSVQADEMIRNGQFSNGIDGWWAAGVQVNTDNGAACVDISNPGNDPWSVILGHGGIGLAQGESYSIRFVAWAETETQMKTLIQHEGPPYTHYIIQDTQVSPQKQQFEYQFTQTLESDAGGEFQFQMGAQQATVVCVANVSIEGVPYIEVGERSIVRTNQLGFLPKANKLVFVQSDSEEPLRWTLANAQGINIDMGRTTPTGVNKASGEQLHRIELSAYTVPMQGLTVTVEGEQSFPFDISENIYSQLKQDAFLYFYNNRSGIAIESAFVQRDDLARPAGHPKDIASCFDQTDIWGTKWPGCDLTIDATGGWYDAGDHGKYTVNSGISTWTLLNLYERSQWVKGAHSPFQSNTTLIPEASNGVDPLLSEARWNVEFMLAMQIPSGTKLVAPVGKQTVGTALTLSDIDASGMAFHKIADQKWTGMPLPPHKNQEKRYVGQPSTAATLNLAAIGAQCARIWKEIDSEFSAKCLTSAQQAWNAAMRQPEVYAYDNFTGSGPYDDFGLSDEWYWAAAELLITTGDKQYQQFIEKSPHYLETPKGNIAAEGDIYWQYTAPLGTISLSIVPNSLDDSAIEKARQAIITTADNYSAQMANEGYNIPYTVEEYPWGSNSNLANRGIFLVYAHDFSGDENYLKNAASAMDYLLGANPMNISYVTGYGPRAASEPHHRFWAKAVDENSPAPAPGALIGGPNSTSFSDPVAAPMKGHCIGQTCYKDKINAWTLNEITINWNAPLLWLSSALDEGKLN